jgi:hypothetical protein
LLLFSPRWGRYILRRLESDRLGSPRNHLTVSTS